MKDIILETLGKLAPDLKLLQDDFYIIGGSALILHDVPLKRTHDIDILCSVRDVDMLKAAWEKYYNPHPIMKENDLFCSHFANFKFPLIEVETQGELKVKKAGQWMPLIIEEYETIQIEGIEVKMPTLSEMKRILNFFGREKDLRRIQEIDNYWYSNRNF